MKILHLTIKKKWFDLIASGKKKHEYREAKTYWKKRLINNWYVPGIVPTFKIFDEIHFKNGYRSDSPFMRVAYYGMAVINPEEYKKPCNGEILKGIQFDIYLGDVLEIKNHQLEK